MSQHPAWKHIVSHAIQPHDIQTLLRFLAVSKRAFTLVRSKCLLLLSITAEVIFNKQSDNREHCPISQLAHLLIADKSLASRENVSLLLSVLHTIQRRIATQWKPPPRAPLDAVCRTKTRHADQVMYLYHFDPLSLVVTPLSQDTENMAWEPPTRIPDSLDKKEQLRLRTTLGSEERITLLFNLTCGDRPFTVVGPLTKLISVTRLGWHIFANENRAYREQLFYWTGREETAFKALVSHTIERIVVAQLESSSSSPSKYEDENKRYIAQQIKRERDHKRRRPHSSSSSDEVVTEEEEEVVVVEEETAITESDLTDESSEVESAGGDCSRDIDSGDASIQEGDEESGDDSDDEEDTSFECSG